MRPGHRRPYVGEGADGARRSAAIDLSEADTYDRDDPRRLEALTSAERWEQQAEQLETECGTLMTERPGDLSIGLGGGRYCTRPKVEGEDVCAVHLGHRKRRATNARTRAAYDRLLRRKVNP